MAAKMMKKKPQMGMGEQAALTPKFLKGLLTKDDGSLTTFGNIANIFGGGLVGQVKSGLDMFRGGVPAMHRKKPLQARRQGTLARMKKRQQDYARAAGLYGDEFDPFKLNPDWKINNPADYQDRNKPPTMRKSAHKSKPAGYVSAAQRKAVWASKKDGGKGNPNRKKKR